MEVPLFSRDVMKRGAFRHRGNLSSFRLTVIITDASSASWPLWAWRNWCRSPSYDHSL